MVLSNNKYDTIIIGGGASGLIAACRSIKNGRKTIVLEKMPRPGRKLRITGKGRCNITNTLEISEFLKHVGPEKEFPQKVFMKFFNTDLITFFNTLGLQIIIERGGRVFPKSGKATDVVDVLVNYIKKNGGRINTNSIVNKLIVTNNKIAGIETNGIKYYASKVIIATGGITYPLTGSTGDGYRLAKEAGHSVHPVYPVLVPLKTNNPKIKRLENLNLRNVNLTAWLDNKKIDEKFGEMIFLDGNLSGPIILKMSRILVPFIRQNKKIVLSLDMKPALNFTKLNNRILRDIEKLGNNPFRLILKGLLPGKMIPICIMETGIAMEKPCNKINPEEIEILVNWLKNQTFEITGTASADEAIITAGGVSTNEVNPNTMESKIISGLHFAGEVLNIDADTGGYNLQIAFSTGWIAGN
ncbi:NAD(P)/FAD-dependent oxidoreductase [Bacteroidota bacterium]